MTNDHSGHSPSAKKPTVHLDKDKLAAARDRARAAATAAPVAPVAPPPPALPPGSVEALLHGLYAAHRAQVWASPKTFRAFMADVLTTTLSQHQPAVDALTDRKSVV